MDNNPAQSIKGVHTNKRFWTITPHARENRRSAPFGSSLTKNQKQAVVTKRLRIHRVTRERTFSKPRIKRQVFWAVQAPALGACRVFTNEKQKHAVVTKRLRIRRVASERTFSKRITRQGRWAVHKPALGSIRVLPHEKQEQAVIAERLRIRRIARERPLEQLLCEGCFVS